MRSFHDLYRFGCEYGFFVVNSKVRQARDSRFELTDNDTSAFDYGGGITGQASDIQIHAEEMMKTKKADRNLC